MRNHSGVTISYAVHNVQHLQNYYVVPFASKLINVCFIQNYPAQRMAMMILSREELDRKVVVIPVLDHGHRAEDYVFFPMLHDDQADRVH